MKEAESAGLTKKDAKGLLHDRDVVAFYGDPAWEARMKPKENAWDQTFSEKDGIFTFEVIPKRGSKSFEPINMNGSERGWRPIFQIFP
jgi:zinc protease